MGTPAQAPDATPEQVALAKTHSHLKAVIADAERVIAEIEKVVPKPVLEAIGIDLGKAAITAVETQI